MTTLTTRLKATVLPALIIFALFAGNRLIFQPELSGTVASTEVVGASAEALELRLDNEAPALANGVRYRLDPSRSKFFIDANRAGVLWFLGHTHHVAAREFAGQADVTAGTLEPASLHVIVNTESLGETAAHFTDEQRQIITKSMKAEVLETAKYPEATLKTTNITAKKIAENQYEVKIEADLTLHGATRQVKFPAKVTIEGDSLHAVGELEIDRDDFNLRTKSIKWGTIQVDDDLKMSFDIIGRRL